jgi:hypothetical protein
MTTTKVAGNSTVFYARHSISKKFSIDESGKVVKESGGQIYDAACLVTPLPRPSELAEALNNLGPRQCISWGILTKGRDRANIAPKSKLKKDDISRTRENFEYPSGSAILMLDIDEPVSFNELLLSLTRVLPDLPTVPYVISHSASTFIYNGDSGACIKGEGGKRVYIFVAEGTDIPRAARVLGARLKLDGHLHYKISKSGQLLERTIIDEAVYQPERLDFCGGAECKPPLVQRRPKPEAFNNGAAPLETRSALPDLTNEEITRLEQLRKEKRKAIQFEATATMEKFANDRAEEFVKHMEKKGIVENQDQIKDKIVQSIEYNVLANEIILYPEEGGEVTVGEVRRNPNIWNRKKFADPIDPTYNDDNRIAMAILEGKDPHICSFAHGGQIYRFECATVEVRVDEGNYPEIVEKAIEMLTQDGEVFQRGGELVRFVKEDTSILPVTCPWLRNKMEKLCTFTKVKKTTTYPVLCPPEIVERILASRGEWTMSVLDGVANLPFMRLDGSIVHRCGYDPETKVYLVRDFDILMDKLQKPTKARVEKALKLIFAPFREFPFAGAVDRGVLLAAILTAAIRPSLPTAPGFFVGAPVFGSGKTLLAQTVAATSGNEPCVMAWPDNDAERRKALVSVLRTNPGNIILDNLTGNWNSVDLAAILTAKEFSDRVLGASETIKVQTTCLVLATGNNVSVCGDLARRILVLILDAGEERPDKRSFDFDPLITVKMMLEEFRLAALTVLRGYLTAKKKQMTEGGMGSFEDWERLVRQAVCWVGAEGLVPFEIADPLLSINKNFEDDNDTNRLKALLARWHACSDKPLSLRDFILLAKANEGELARSDVPLKDDESTDCLYDMLCEIAGKGNEINTKMLAAWLRRHQKRVVDGLYVEQYDKVQNIARWRVVRVEKE